MNAGHPDLDKLARDGSAKVGQMLLQRRLKAEEGQICLLLYAPEPYWNSLAITASSTLHAIVMSLSVQECVMYKW